MDDESFGAIGELIPDDYSEPSEPFLGFPTLGEMSTGDSIETGPPETVPSTEVEKPKRTRTTSTRTSSRSRSSADDAPPRDAKTGPPSLDEWTKFLSRVVLKCSAEWYLNWAFRGIDEDALTERDVERLVLSDDEKKTIAVPFAELANKSKFMRKHGRMIVASGDAFNALVIIGAWTSRVNRIAKKYRPKQPQRGKVTLNGSSGPSAPQASADEFRYGTGGGSIPPGFNGVIPGSG